MSEKVYVVLFPGFTALDVFGPVEVLSKTDAFEIHYISLQGGIVGNEQGIRMETEAFASVGGPFILLVPGGFGTRQVIKDAAFMEGLRRLGGEAEYVLTVCTGSALAAAAGLLDGRLATSNRRSFKWAAGFGPKVYWDVDVRWTVDGKFYTSAGVSAGIDMALGFVRDRFGEEMTREIADRMEYQWREVYSEGK